LKIKQKHIIITIIIIIIIIIMPLHVKQQSWLVEATGLQGDPHFCYNQFSMYNVILVLNTRRC